MYQEIMDLSVLLTPAAQLEVIGFIPIQNQ